MCKQLPFAFSLGFCKETFAPVLRGFFFGCVGLDLVFNYGAVESQKNLRVDILECWLNVQHPRSILHV